MELNITYIVVLIIIGSFAGVINILAGGGSNLTLPTLMIMGMPPEVANASNRVGIFIQSLVGMRGFNKHGMLDTTDLPHILIPTLIGGVLGGLLASFAPPAILKPLLLGVMLSMALLILIRPTVIAPEPGTPFERLRDTPRAWVGLGLAGLYGGFVQAGAGFVLLAALAGTLRYDLIRANALKLVCTLAFTIVALAIFIARDQVDWLPALVLTVGYIIGAQLGVKIAIRVRPETLKWFLFIMTLVACVAALVF
ncbi:MAG: sulfite exporter TauE/SafE family protein [Gammaproteobacteria bacterium]|nr:sulfite exporter TauE/SafE family protein [Gammaproteobacteria bacterium]